MDRGLKLSFRFFFGFDLRFEIENFLSQTGVMLEDRQIPEETGNQAGDNDQAND